jgi:hypothetical protein
MTLISLSEKSPPRPSEGDTTECLGGSLGCQQEKVYNCSPGEEHFPGWMTTVCI